MIANENQRGHAKPLGWVLAWVVLAAGSFHVAYAFPHASIFILFYLFALVQLARLETWRRAFYSGLALEPSSAGRLPLDRWLAPAASGLTGLISE